MGMTAVNTVRYFVGTSGWHYDHWRGRLYPPELAKARWLTYYARSFPTVEVNASFYRLPTENALRGWYEQSPPGFVFALKASRLITHYRRLLGTAEALALFFARARLLGEKLGPILYQLPPDMARDDTRLAGFLAQLPPDLKHAIEFRHPSWFTPPVYELLGRHGVAFCVFHLVGLACPLVATAPFVYVRFHGTGGKYWGAYGAERLERWRRQIESLSAGREEVYAYFNNDAEAQAVYDARLLQARLQGGPLNGLAQHL